MEKSVLVKFCFLLYLCCVSTQDIFDDDRRMHSHRPNKPRKNIREGESDPEFWINMAQEKLASRLAIKNIERPARNVIMFLGDGMSIPTMTAARNAKDGEQSSLVWENFPSLGLSKTYCVDGMVADSACSATAYLGGVKTNVAMIGLTAAVQNKDCVGQQNSSNHVHSFIRKAQLFGKATGFVTTTRATHASPSGVYAHIADRDWESDYDMISIDGQDTDVCDDIAEQLVRGETGKNLNIILAGGRSKFLPNTTEDEDGVFGERWDEVDLIQEWIEGKETDGVSHAWVYDKETLNDVSIENTDYVFGLFEPSHLKYHLDNDNNLKPSLPELTEFAIKSLSRHPNGFVLFVEGGRIDHAHHFTRAHRALDETLELEKAVEIALNLTDSEDTLIVVTADHAHTMSISGYPDRGANIFGIALEHAGDELPTAILTYANGNGYKAPESDGSRYDISNDNMDDDKYEFPSLAPLSSETHGGDDVAVFAQGPWSHLLTGTYEQHYIEHVMSYAACVNDGKDACSGAVTALATLFFVCLSVSLSFFI